MNVIEPNESISEVKQKFLEPLNEISYLYNLPKDTLTLGFLISNLAKLKDE